MSRRHCVLVVLLLIALCPGLDELVLGMLGVEDDRGAYCPRVRAMEVERVQALGRMQRDEVCALQADAGPESVDPPLLWCPADPTAD